MLQVDESEPEQQKHASGRSQPAAAAAVKMTIAARCERRPMSPARLFALALNVYLGQFLSPPLLWLRMRL